MGAYSSFCDGREEGKHVQRRKPFRHNWGSPHISHTIHTRQKLPNTKVKETYRACAEGQSFPDFGCWACRWHTCTPWPCRRGQDRYQYFRQFPPPQFRQPWSVLFTPINWDIKKSVCKWRWIISHKDQLSCHDRFKQVEQCIPLRSASWTTKRAARSLTDPPGFMNSALA